MKKRTGPPTKLGTEVEREIFSLIQRGEKIDYLALVYGVHSATIRRIRQRNASKAA